MLLQNVVGDIFGPKTRCAISSPGPESPLYKCCSSTSNPFFSLPLSKKSVPLSLSPLFLPTTLPFHPNPNRQAPSENSSFSLAGNFSLCSG
ncbi:hypothetical protein K1719_030494 [Acacia pycnantha]|nr:hypothetical protein K1719_030494 [Acacia pycnantha]